MIALSCAVIDHTAYRFRVDDQYLFVSRQNYTKSAKVGLLCLQRSQAPLSLVFFPPPTLG